MELTIQRGDSADRVTPAKHQSSIHCPTTFFFNYSSDLIKAFAMIISRTTYVAVVDNLIFIEGIPYFILSITNIMSIFSR